MVTLMPEINTIETTQPVLNQETSVSKEAVTETPVSVSPEGPNENSGTLEGDLTELAEHQKELADAKAEYAKLVDTLRSTFTTAILQRMADYGRRYNGYKYISFSTVKKTLSVSDTNPSEKSIYIGMVLAHKEHPSIKFRGELNTDTSKEGSSPSDISNDEIEWYSKDSKTVSAFPLPCEVDMILCDRHGNVVD